MVAGNENVVSVRLELTDLNNMLRGLKTASNAIEKIKKTANDASTNKLGKSLDQIGQEAKQSSTAIEKFNDKMQEFQRTSIMWALGLLFFGMQIQRIFKGILTSTTQFYREVTEGNTMQAEGLTRLASAWQFLKFSIGDAIATALLPLIPMIVDLIDGFSNWASENQKLVAGLVLGGVVIGTILMVLGQLALGLGSLIMIGGKVVAFFASLGMAGTASFALLTAGIFAVGAVLAGFFSELDVGWKDAGDAIKSIVKGILISFGILFKGGQLVAVTFNLVGNAIKAFLTAAAIVALKAIEMVVDGVDFLLRQLNKIPGVDLGQIGSVDFSNRIRDLERNLVDRAGQSNQLLQRGAQLSQEQRNFNIGEINIEAGRGFDENAFVEELNRRTGPQLQVS
jgi:hypothetical protein